MTDKMTPEQAIKILQSEQHYTFSEFKICALGKAIEALEKQKWHKYEDEKPTKEGQYLCCNFILPNTPCFSIYYWSNDLYEVDKFDFEDGKGMSGFYEYCSEWGHYHANCAYWKPIDWESDKE